MRQWMVRFFVPVVTVTLVGLALSIPCAGGDDFLTATGERSSGVDAKVIAYYFHGTLRCSTCRTIEAYSEEAITKEFTNEIASGRLAWRVVNVDEPENKHFVEDFALASKSLVLAEYRDGKVTRHENLQQIWQLVRDKEAFLAYVRAATSDFLRGG